MSERVSIDALKPGMVILQITEQNGPVRIRKSGLVTSDAMVQGLKEMGVLQLDIDPAQTVELAEEPITQSQTQFLLQSNASTQPVSSHSNSAQGAHQGSQQDSQLAEQFNRSLFLPTAQEIPDTWQLHLKQGIMALVVVVAGLGIGFGAAQYLNNTTVVDDALVAENEQAPEKEQPFSNNENTENTESETASEQNETKAPQVAAQDPKADADTVDGVSDSSENTQEEQSDQIVVGLTEVEEPLVLGTAPEDNGLVMNAQGEMVKSDALVGGDEVSEELLQKFQQAMAELEQQEAETGVDAEPTVVAPEPDVPRVDQMPQWILSSLPKLAFSAHMYASEPADRWVKVNNVELGEGDWIDGQLRIASIEPQHVILNFEGHEFSMLALSEW